MNPTDVIFKAASEWRVPLSGPPYVTIPTPPLIDRIATVWPEVAKELCASTFLFENHPATAEPTARWNWLACRACVQDKVLEVLDGNPNDEVGIAGDRVLRATTPAEWAVAVRALIDAIGGGE